MASRFKKRAFFHSTGLAWCILLVILPTGNFSALFPPLQFPNFQLNDFLTSLGVYLSALLLSFVSGMVPFINIELFLLFVATCFDKSQFLPIVLLAALGQMIAKALMYLVGKGMIKISIRKDESRLQKTLNRLKKVPSRVQLVIFTSAFTGFPPFYLTAVAAGMIRANFSRFFLFSYAGRCLRFGFLLYFPHYFKQVLA